MTEITRSRILYGMKKSGKSTLGAELADHLGVDFVDTDRLVEVWGRGRSCAELAADPGVDFGELQEKAILSFRPEAPLVIATGGSAAMYQKVVNHLGCLGTGIYVDVAPAVLFARYTEEDFAALNNPNNLTREELNAVRRPAYQRASLLTLNVDKEEPIAVTSERLIGLASWDMDARLIAHPAE